MIEDYEKQTIADRHFRRNVYCFLGLPLDALRLDEVIARVRNAKQTNSRLVLLTPNTNDIVQSLSNTHFRNAFLTSDLSIADGMPVVWLSRFLGLPVRERLAGADIFDRLRQGLAGRMTVFFFGGDDGVADIARQKINRARGDLLCIGAVSPGFGSLQELSDSSYIEQINRADPDLLVLSLGKQGKPWILENARKIHRGVVSHLGAVVNFTAERINRAPKPLQTLGLEWLWRIWQEPVLFHRYFHDAQALSRLIYACVVPLRLEQLRYSIVRPKNRTPELRVLHRDGSITLQLQGAWTADDLEPLKNALTLVCDRKSNIVFDLGAVTYLDSAAVGTIVSAYGWQLRNERHFTVSAASAPATRILRLHCCDYLFD